MCGFQRETDERHDDWSTVLGRILVVFASGLCLPSCSCRGLSALNLTAVRGII